MLLAASPWHWWLCAIAGVLLDTWLGEPRRWHPLVGFGRCAGVLERRWNRPSSSPAHGRLRGLMAWLLLVAPPVALAALAFALPHWLAWPCHAVALYAALGARSLGDHARPIAAALRRADLPAARQLTGRIVSRDTSDADASALAKAAVESTLENGNDAIFGTLFWFALAGAPGAVLYRLANTLDAMWGYRTPRLRHFGWSAARLDDALNWLPARLTAASYALLGHCRAALACWCRQAPRWPSPNAGPVMASGAGSLRVRLGGAARYDGVVERRPRLGCGDAPSARHVDAALRLVKRTLLLWLACWGVAALCFLLFRQR